MGQDLLGDGSPGGSPSPIFSQLSYQGGGNAALSALGISQFMVLLSVAMDGYHENRILKPLGRAYNAVISPSP